MNRLSSALQRFFPARSSPYSHPSSSSSEQQASLLGGVEKPADAGDGTAKRLFKGLPGKRLIIGAVALISILAVLGSQRHKLIPQDPAVHTPQFVHVLIPTTQQKDDVDLCKTIISGHILNYPIPTLISWGQDDEGDDIPEKNRVNHKLLKIYRWLEKLPESSDTGLVLVLDEPNTWFQLRLEVLIQRYWDASRRADNRMKWTYNNVTTQKIMFPAANDCAPNKETDLACYAVPAPIGGGNTGARYLGKGAMIGTTKEVRLFMKRALEKSEKNSRTEARHIFAEIFGEQEYQREVLRRTHWWYSFSRWFERREDILAVKPDRQVVNSKSEGFWEYGVGLDYANELGFDSSLGADVMEWTKPRGLAKDIKRSMLPFWTTGGSQAGLPHGADWTSVDLLSRKDTHTVPAMIHHTSNPTSPVAELRQEWWPHLWMQPYARTLFSAVMGLPSTVIASANNKTGHHQRYWNIRPQMEKDGVWLHDGNFTYWPYMCNDEGDDEVISYELFRDHEGKWKKDP